MVRKCPEEKDTQAGYVYNDRLARPRIARVEFGKIVLILTVSAEYAYPLLIALWSFP